MSDKRPASFTSFPQKWSEDAFVLLCGLKHSVIWELAPAIVAEISRLVEEGLKQAAAQPSCEINPTYSGVCIKGTKACVSKHEQFWFSMYSAWARYSDGRIMLCDSDAPKAFKLFRQNVIEAALEAERGKMQRLVTAAQDAYIFIEACRLAYFLPDKEMPDAKEISERLAAALSAIDQEK